MNYKNKSNRISRAVQIVLFIVFTALFSRAQNDNANKIIEPDQKLVLRFASYSDELDLRVKEVLAKEEFRSSFTCIPIGIIVLKAGLPFDQTQMDRLRIVLAKVKELPEYSILESFSVADAETECASVRSSSK